MQPADDWKKYWDDKADRATSDYNFDRAEARAIESWKSFPSGN